MLSSTQESEVSRITQIVDTVINKSEKEFANAVKTYEKNWEIEEDNAVIVAPENRRTVERNQMIIDSLKQTDPEVKKAVETIQRTSEKAIGKEMEASSTAEVRMQKAAAKEYMDAIGTISEKLKEKGMSLYDNGKLVQIRREYKKINLNRFLKQTEAKLEYLDRHERFVKLLYYDNTWISNYGRPVIKKEDGTYEFVKGKRNKITQEIEYSLRKNIYIKTKKAWGYKQERVSASSLFMMIIGEEHDLGVFDTKEECYEAFEKRKKEFIIKLAEKTKKKDKIPECQYQAMINWEVKAKE